MTGGFLNAGKFVILKLQPVAHIHTEGQQGNGNFGYNAAVLITDIGIVAPDINDGTDHSLADEVGECLGLGSGQLHGVLGSGESLDHVAHVLGQITDSTDAFGILSGLTGLGTVDDVPVGAGGNRHLGNGEVLVQHIHGSGGAAAAGADNGSADLHALVDLAGGVEQTVQEGQQRAVGGGIVHRAAHHHAVSCIQLFGGFVDDIIDDTVADLVAGAAALAAADQQVADVDHFGFDALLGEDLSHLLQRKSSVALFLGAAVDQKNFHNDTPFKKAAPLQGRLKFS